eukprot:2251680-Pyramimonas_sp.AAC.1
MAKCRKCHVEVKEGCRHAHENKCRGSELLNRTCAKCGKVFEPTDPPGMLSRPCGVHEKWCRGVRVPAPPDPLAPAAVAPVAAPVVPKAKPKAKGGAKVMAAGRGRGAAAKARGRAPGRGHPGPGANLRLALRRPAGHG